MCGRQAGSADAGGEALQRLHCNWGGFRVASSRQGLAGARLVARGNIDCSARSGDLIFVGLAQLQNFRYRAHVACSAPPVCIADVGLGRRPSYRVSSKLTALPIVPELGLRTTDPGQEPDRVMFRWYELVVWPFCQFVELFVYLFCFGGLVV